jgi:small nuclear ribonucleoprotein (snRNP)-like protein
VSQYACLDSPSSTVILTSNNLSRLSPFTQGQRIIVAVRGGARLQGTLSTFDVNSPITSTTRIILKDAAEVQRNGNAPASAGEHPGLAMPEVYLRAGEIGTVEIAPSGGPASTSVSWKDRTRESCQPQEIALLIFNRWVWAS